MNEKEYTKILIDTLGNQIKGCEIKTGEALIYKIILDKKLNYSPQNAKEPIRGQFAFETDIMIKKVNLPLVVIEVKYGGLTTHDIITYSDKAKRHKEIYPYLRYGLVIGGFDSIVPRFFVHNRNFDFAMVLKEDNNSGLLPDDEKILLDIINKQIKDAETLFRITPSVDSEKKVDYLKFYNTTIEFKNG